MPSKFYNVFQLIAQYFPQELVETNKELKGKWPSEYNIHYGAKIWLHMNANVTQYPLDV